MANTEHRDPIHLSVLSVWISINTLRHEIHISQPSKVSITLSNKFNNSNLHSSAATNHFECFGDLKSENWSEPVM